MAVGGLDTRGQFSSHDVYVRWMKRQGHLVAVLLPYVFLAEFANVEHGGLALEYIVCTTHM